MAVTPTREVTPARLAGPVRAEKPVRAGARVHPEGPGHATPGGPAARSGEPDLERHRGELTGYCYRLLGSFFDAEDAAQETLVRAWRGYDRFEGRASVRAWLYRIATNVCFDMSSSAQRRARPMDLAPAAPPDLATLPAALPDAAWVLPAPDARVLGEAADPADHAVWRESVRLAFLVALQHLPPRQRAVLILRSVLSWRASEVADLLDTTVASVNSALQRARATLSALDPAALDRRAASADQFDRGRRALLDRYVDAFERFDIDRLVALLHREATLSMPPLPLWLRGPVDIAAWLRGPGQGCRGSRLVPVAANGGLAFGQYRPAADGGHEPWSFQVVEIAAGQIVTIDAFLDVDRLFPLFGLPARLPPGAPAAARSIGD